MATLRAFIAVEVQPTDLLAQYAMAVKGTDADVKLVEPHNIHLTVKFLGDTDEALLPEIEAAMRTAAEGIAPFDLTLAGTGVFPSPGYIKVLWVGIKAGEPLAIMAERLEEALARLGFAKERRPFSPHLTIGRVRSTKNKAKLLDVVSEFSTTTFAVQHVDTVVLKRSMLSPKGPTYTTLRTVPLS